MSQPTASGVPVYYSPAHTLAGHSFDTTRKAAWVADSCATDRSRTSSCWNPNRSPPSR
jgi:hypothetical protein